MLVSPIERFDIVPADSLFQTWRGHAPYAHRLAQVRTTLYDEHAGLTEAVAATPFAQFERACGPAQPVQKYQHVAPDALAMIMQIPAALRSPWLAALLIDHMTQFDARFAESRLNGEFALHYIDAFHRILDQIVADPGFAVITSDSFLKDLWLTRVVMIPAFAQLWWPRSGLAGRDLMKGGFDASRYVFGRCGGRRPFMEGHTHDPMARAYWNEAGWGQALRLAAMALPALPHIKGVFGTAWFYDPAIITVSPRIAFAQDLQMGRGACRLRVGSSPAAIANATATSPGRRARHQEGSYMPTDYTIIWSRGDLIRAYRD
jgi:hypothetical protein